MGKYSGPSECEVCGAEYPCSCHAYEELAEVRAKLVQLTAAAQEVVKADRKHRTMIDQYLAEDMWIGDIQDQVAIRSKAIDALASVIDKSKKYEEIEAHFLWKDGKLTLMGENQSWSNCVTLSLPSGKQARVYYDETLSEWDERRILTALAAILGAP